MLDSKNWEAVVAELATRPGHEKVRALMHHILVDGLGVESQNIVFEKRLTEVHGRVDALLGRTVFEFKSDFRRERQDAERGLTRYLTDREQQSGEKYVGVATDGAEFVAYFLKEDGVIEVAQHKVDPEKPHAVLEWVESAIAVAAEVAPEPEVVIREFGRSSLAARRALDELDLLWSEVRGTPEAGLKRQLWTRLLSLAYGADVGNETLFLQHTYLVIVAKAMAWMAMFSGEPDDAAALLHGRAFSELGITGQSEPDFFDWVLRMRRGPELVMRIARQVGRLRLHDIRTDILKALYESLIDPDTRHKLGEYYTPDWLATRIVATAVDDPLEQRVMDPACGSGTFLFHAVRNVLVAADAAGFSKADAVRRAIDKVAGIDVHPVAVIFARVTYLLAIMSALRKEHPGELAIPVYLGDALQWNRMRVAQDAEQPDLLADDGTLEISIPAARITEPAVRTLSAATLRFPAALAGEAQLFDLVVKTMIALAARGEDEDNFSAWMQRQRSISGADRRVLRSSYRVMRRLQSEGRNHIWGYVARNLARPVWLSSEAQMADVVIGNPPWVSFRHMDAKFQEQFRNECQRTSLWVGAQVATQQDLSSYFYMRAAVLYMRKSGKIALVMPYAAMSRKAYAEFRKGEISDNGNVEMRLRFTRGWAFGPSVQPLFPVPSCVLFAEAHTGAEPSPLPSTVQRFSGILPTRNATEAEARRSLSQTKAPWPKEAADEGGSVYRNAFRNGATLWPRRLVLVERVRPRGKLPANPEAPLIRGRAGRQDKKPWKTMRPPSGAVERRFLYPIHLGETIAPFLTLRPREAVVPWNSDESGLMDSEDAANRGFRQLAEWLEKSEALWDRHKQTDLSLREQIDYYGKLSTQFPTAPIRVVYTKAGTRLAAAVVEDDRAIVEQALFWARATTLSEAHYLCGILNSDALREKVQEYQSQGQWGARHFDKYVFNIPIPQFKRGNALHRALGSAARTAGKVAEGVEIDESEYFTKTRRRIRDALAEHGIAQRLEELSENVLKGS